MNKSSLLRNALLGLVILATNSAVLSQTPLANQPVFTIIPVPGNMALAVSVEFPTVLSTAHPTIGLQGTDPNYTSATEYVGYFDPNKCYQYQHSATETDRHFYPSGPAANRTCTAAWSGNFLNWATASTIDVFRWALTGGFRKVDSAQAGATPGVTWLEKSWSSDTGDANDQRHPFRRLATNAAVAGATPLAVNSALFRVHGLGNKIWISANNGLTADPNSTVPTAYVSGGLTDANAIYELSVRVKVCDAAVGLEANCVKYGSTYKPEGLMQKYAEKVRYSTFSYLNDSDLLRDGGVLRARQAFIGPLQAVPLSTSVNNPLKEWDEVTGVIFQNPRPADAAATVAAFTSGDQPVNPILHSGSLNYINKFGQINATGGFNTNLSYKYKRYDNVGELYYAATRYLKGHPNVASWTNMSGATSAQKNQFLDAFPVINNWTWDNIACTNPSSTGSCPPPTEAIPTPSDVRDPILYSCQKNFILGIGDVNTHADKNVPGSTNGGGANEPALPGFSPDLVAASAETTRIGTMQGVSGTVNGTSIPSWSANNQPSYLMAGIAYDSNTRDIRLDVASKPQTIGQQTIQTYWVDVLEFARYRANNQFYLAAKYGGFKVPPGYNPDTNTPLTLDSWYNTTRMSPTSANGDAPQQMPDNYFVSARADQLVAGLSAAFDKVAEAIGGTTTASATALPQVAGSGDTSYSTNYDPKTWSSDVKAATVNFASPTTAAVPRWSFSSKLASQLAGTGWNSNRRMATWNDATQKGVPFRHDDLSADQKAALDTPWRTGNDAQDYLNYLRGDRTNETTSPNYRKRPAISATDTNFVGDIIGSKLNVVGRPASLLEDEPGFIAFRDSWNAGAVPPTGRRTVVYVGSNGGVLHAINGAPYAADPGGALPAGVPIPEIDADAGREMFSYVPSALFKGVSNPSTAATRAENGLAALGNPSYVHRNFVNATPKQFDIDLVNTEAGKANTLSCLKAAGDTSPNWRTVLIGGLGKGGRSYYALDVTDPSAITDEEKLAKKVMWEFPRKNDPKDLTLDSKVGFTFGEPVVVRTERHGWVVVFTSGYNSVDGKSYFFIVDPCTGYLVQPPVPTKTGITSIGMAHATAYQTSIGSGYADAVYAGDLRGNVWRLDIRPPAADYAEAERIATLTDGTASATPWQPITTRPRVEYDPKTFSRFVMVGTGRLLDESDISSVQKQSFYAFKDGNTAVFDVDLPDSNSNQGLLRSDFIDISANLVSGATFTNQKGWLINLGAEGNGNNLAGTGWRMVNDSTALLGTGRLLFFAILPSSSDPCIPGAQSVIYGVNFGTGKSFLLNASSQLVGSKPVEKQLVDLRTLATGGGTSVIGGDSTGGTFAVPTEGFPVPGLRRLNWREIPLSQ
jgi:type IV pilus assembly protein PilY1